MKKTIMKSALLALMMLTTTETEAQTDDSRLKINEAEENISQTDQKNEESAERTSTGENDYELAQIGAPSISPQAADLKKYGEYPIDYSTGVPNISIPLYEIVVGDFTLPITMAYHASGIKVQEIASPVGLGWTLLAGGCITRQIKGRIDAGRPGLIGEEEIQARINNGYSSNSGWYYTSIGKGEDTESDRYTYNFNGKSGVFRYAVNDMSIKTIPYTPMRIEEYGNGFKITDTDGIKYYFLTEEKNRGDYTYGGNYETMAWYLTKIELSDRNDSIVFNYAQDRYYYQQFVSEQINQGVQYSYNEDWDTWNQTNNDQTEFDRAYHTMESSNMLLSSIRLHVQRYRQLSLLLKLQLMMEV